jgi:hypothetical protein
LAKENKKVIFFLGKKNKKNSGTKIKEGVEISFNAISYIQNQEENKYVN